MHDEDIDFDRRYEMSYDMRQDAAKVIRDEWLDTPHGRLWQALTDYIVEDGTKKRWGNAMERLDERYEEYEDEHMEETIELMLEAEEYSRDPYGYHGVRRSDF